MVASCEVHSALIFCESDGRGQSLRVAAPRLKAHVDAHVSEDGVGQVAVEVAGYGLAIGATRFEELRVPAERVGYAMFIAEALLAAIPAAIDASAAALNRDLFARDIFRFVVHANAPTHSSWPRQ